MPIIDSHNYRVVREDRPTGVAQVYEATHAEHAGRLLVEVLSAGSTAPAALQAFERDVAAVTLLAHPGVLEVLDLGATADGTPVVIYDFPDGGTLGRWLEENRAVAIDDALEAIAALADALTAAHEGGVSHGALRPELVSLVKERGRGALGTPKVRGFGQRWLIPGADLPAAGASGPSPEEIADDVRALARIAELLLTPPDARGAVEGLAFDTAPEAASVIRNASAGGDDGFASPRAFAAALAEAFRQDGQDKKVESRALVLFGVRALTLTRLREAPKLAIGLAAGVSVSLLVALIAGFISEVAPDVEARPSRPLAVTAAAVPPPPAVTRELPAPAPAIAPVTSPAAQDAKPTARPVVAPAPTPVAAAKAKPAAPVASNGPPRRPAAATPLRGVVWSDTQKSLVSVDENGLPLAIEPPPQPQ